MNDYLNQLKELKVDAVFFVPSDDEQLHIEGVHYKTPGEKVYGSELGDFYHIILFREDEDGGVKDLDMFEAILGSPLDYIKNMINCKFFGLVARKTTTSDKFAKDAYDGLSKI